MIRIKKGFTLAEVLITLSIIGVVAALTMPVLVQNVDSTRVGPSLAKAKNTFENAVEMMLHTDNVNSLLAIGNTGANIGARLQNFMKIKQAYIGFNSNIQIKGSAIATYTAYESDDGMIYFIGITAENNRPGQANGYDNIPTNQLIGIVYVDINGGRRPNNEAQDRFPFLLYNDGTLRPYGGVGANRSDDANIPVYTGNNCENRFENPATCTGSIFANDLRVVYNYSGVADTPEQTLDPNCEDDDCDPSDEN